MEIIGIYKIQSKIYPDRIYIGSSVNFKLRIRLHLNNLNRNKHHNIKLQNHYNKYGKHDLQFIFLESCEKDNLIRVEQKYINNLSPYFNICQVAGSALGVKRTEETKRKMSIALKGRIGAPHSDELKMINSLCHIGHEVTPETRHKISQSLKGVPLDKERKLKISNTLKGRKTSNGNTGMSHTEEHKRKISESMKLAHSKKSLWKKAS